MTDTSEVRPDAAREVSPLPWRWDDMGNLLSSDDKVVLSIGCGYDGLWGGDYPSEANAALIVRCVNQSTQRDARLAAIVQEMESLRTQATALRDGWSVKSREVGERLLRVIDQLAALGADEEGK